MQNGTISLKQALAIMNQKDAKGTLIPFELTYRTFNSTSKRGGRLKTYSGARLLLQKNPNVQHRDTLENILLPVKKSRNAHHFENRTRNIELSDRLVVTIRIDFIITINQLTVIY